MLNALSLQWSFTLFHYMLISSSFRVPNRQTTRAKQCLSRGSFSDGEHKWAANLLWGFTSRGEVARGPTPAWDSDPICILEVSPGGIEFREESFQRTPTVQGSSNEQSLHLVLSPNNTASERERLGCAWFPSPQGRSLGCWAVGKGLCGGLFPWAWGSEFLQLGLSIFSWGRVRVFRGHRISKSGLST